MHQSSPERERKNVTWWLNKLTVRKVSTVKRQIVTFHQPQRMHKHKSSVTVVMQTDGPSDDAQKTARDSWRWLHQTSCKPYNTTTKHIRL